MLKNIINTSAKRLFFLLLVDSAMIAISLFLAFFLRFEGEVPAVYLMQMMRLIGIFLLVKISFSYFLGLYNISWEYVSLREIILVGKASAYSLLALGSITLILIKAGFLGGFPRSVLAIDSLCTFLFISGFRLSKRIYLRFTHQTVLSGERTLIIGAGDAGEQIARNIIETKDSRYLPVGFIDDNPLKKNMAIHGVRVFGERRKIPILVRSLDIKLIIIAMPSAPSGVIRETVAYARKAGVNRIKILPSLIEIIAGNVGIKNIQDIQPEDLLGRQEVKIDTASIERYIKNRTVLVTGAGGSVGSELCRQIANLQPALLAMVDIGDTELFYIDRDIREKFPGVSIKAVIADVKDAVAMNNIFSIYRPQVVFHAAAYKHVPMMETNVREAVLNNIEGTRVIAEASLANNTEKFIFISTDKAVDPTSIMGATKKIAENLLKCYGPDRTKFISVRFGNVLESRGSIVPLIKEEIKKGGPVTITHPRMQRYFMSIVEAAYLVLEAGAMCRGGETFVLDMGKPIKILDLAKEIIRFYGLQPDKDIPIVFTGIRPGEKLSEGLLTAQESRLATRHNKIFITKNADNFGLEYLEKIARLIKESCSNVALGKVVPLIKELLPAYHPNNQNNLTN